MRCRWQMCPQHPLLAGQIAREARVSPLLAQCLLNRGLSDSPTIQAFLEPRLKRLADPFLLPNMGAAVDRFMLARQQGQSVVVFGDYDVDGVTSTALLLEVLRALGWNVSCYLPHRMEDGYGLSREGLEHCLRDHKAELLIAVDCGSTAVESITWLKERGIDVVVLDHHQASPPLPPAVAIVNPFIRNGSSEMAEAVSYRTNALGSKNGQPHPFQELCSAGLAFKFAHALVKRARELGIAAAAEFDLRPLLDLVALGTIADVVPLCGENRILVSAGLERLSRTTRPGLVALKQVAQCPASLGPYEVGFQLGPRLNAAGRLETAEEALRLVLAQESAEALRLAQGLDRRNRERQAIEKQIAKEAIQAIEARFKPETDFVIVEGGEPWHIGVVGIVAARVLRQFYRPTIIVGGDGAQWRGSGRSIDGFDLAGALRQCDDLLLRHGGHAMAAGVSLVPEKLDEFRTRLNEIARKSLPADSLRPPLALDAEVGLDEMRFETIVELERLKPVGQGNPPVQLQARNLMHQKALKRIGLDKQHVKLWVCDETTTLEAVWWGAGNEELPVGRFDLAFTPQLNEYQGQRRIQLKVLDWRPATTSTARAGGQKRT